MINYIPLPITAEQQNLTLTAVSAVAKMAQNAINQLPRPVIVAINSAMKNGVALSVHLQMKNGAVDIVATIGPETLFCLQLPAEVKSEVYH